MRGRTAMTIVPTLALLLAAASVARADMAPFPHGVPSPTPLAKPSTKFEAVKGWGPLTFSMTLDEARAALKKEKIDARETAGRLEFKSADGFVTVTSRKDGERTLVRRISITPEPFGGQVKAKARDAAIAQLKDRYGTPAEAEDGDQVYVWENKDAKLELTVAKRHDFYIVKQTWSRPGDEASRD